MTGDWEFGVLSGVLRYMAMHRTYLDLIPSVLA